MVKKDAEIVKIDPAHPGQAFARCRDVIFAGGVIVYPTDTFTVSVLTPAMLLQSETFAIKDRQHDQPILLLIKDANRCGIGGRNSRRLKN
jgi:tRNA A37 threonylcarbamoyladenosine synthetase subunit TsaC/SUA5/YrdC